MVGKKLVAVLSVLVLSTGVFAVDKKTASGILMDKEWKVKVYNYSKENFIHTAWGHGHNERVYNLSVKLAGMEGLKIDKDVLFAAAFLHDIGAFNKIEGEEHEVTGANMVGPILKEFGFPEEKIEHVKQATLYHYWTAKNIPDDPTVMIFHDADTLDFMGNIGIARTLSLTTRIKNWVPTLDKAFGSLERINKKFGALMKTKSAKEIAKKRSKEAMQFLNSIREETYNKTAI